MDDNKKDELDTLTRCELIEKIKVMKISESLLIQNVRILRKELQLDPHLPLLSEVWEDVSELRKK